MISGGSDGLEVNGASGDLYYLENIVHYLLFVIVWMDICLETTNQSFDIEKPCVE